jgi:hypothetical protein
MKSKKLRLLTALLLLLPLCVVLLGAGCDDDDEYSDMVEGYIVGSFQCNNSDERGFCIILTNNADSIRTFSLPEDIFDFPPGVIKAGHNAYTGGPFFFPDSLRYKYDIRFRYRQPDESEVIDCSLAFNTMGFSFPWENWNYVIIEDINKP